MFKVTLLLAFPKRGIQSITYSYVRIILGIKYTILYILLSSLEIVYLKIKQSPRAIFQT